MARTASPVAPSAPVTALDADGEEFTLDFGFPEVSTARPAVVAPEVDSTAAKLASEQVSNHFRRAHLADKGLLPR